MALVPFLELRLPAGVAVLADAGDRLLWFLRWFLVVSCSGQGGVAVGLAAPVALSGGEEELRLEECGFCPGRRSPILLTPAFAAAFK